jgi:hypothetical protein
MNKVIYYGISAGAIVIVVALFVWFVTKPKEARELENSQNTAAQSVTSSANISDAEAKKNLEKRYAIDADLDGILDADESKFKTNPQNADSDGDGLLDNDEITVLMTNPIKSDTDGDGVLDLEELIKGRDPLVKQPLATNTKK